MAAMRAVLLLSLVLAAAPVLARQSSHGPYECDPDLPHLEAGHITLTDKNFKKWKKENSKLHVLGASDSSCTKCCHTESILAQLKDKFDSKAFTGRKGKKIQIGRVDISEQYDFLAAEGVPIDDAPAIFVMHEGRYFRYQLDTAKQGGHYDDISGILHFINRLQHPLLQLDSEEAIEAFLNEVQEPAETTGFFKKSGAPYLGETYSALQLKTRVIAFIFDTEEFESELKLIKDAARVAAQRVSLRVGIVTDPKLCRKYKARKGRSWFNDDV